MVAHNHIHQGQIHLKWSRDQKPQLTISSGEIVTFDCKEASNGQVTPSSSVDAISTFDASLADPVFGPVYIREAEPGDSLEVEIIKLEHAGWAWSAIVEGFGLLAEDFKDDGPQLKLWKISTDAKTAEFNDEISIPVRPFLGTMGVAPEEQGEFSTIPPRETGGNIDCRHITEGCSLILPVKAPGALFSCGDGHIAQGDGEVCGTAIETAMKATLRFTVHKNQTHITTPHYRCPRRAEEVLPDCGTYSTIGIDPDVLKATQKATREMIAWLGKEKGLSRTDAYMLCSIAVDLRMAEVVDMPNYAISATIPLNIFKSSTPAC